MTFDPAIKTYFIDSLSNRVTERGVLVKVNGKIIEINGKVCWLTKGAAKSALNAKIYDDIVYRLAANDVNAIRRSYPNNLPWQEATKLWKEFIKQMEDEGVLQYVNAKDIT